MGNSISKKKAKASFGTNRSPSKVKAFWNFGHVDKFKEAGQKQDEHSKLTVHYTAPQHYQENVFIEGSRPKYLEDLHIEAQEGLKILQQEEHNNGVDFQDDQTLSTVTPRDDVGFQERDGCLDFGNTTDHSVTSVSNRTAVSSRPALTRQGSTFKPLNTVKRLDKTKKRTRRTTIMGIPQQVQKELGMGRDIFLQQLSNGEDDGSSGTVIIPTIVGEIPVAILEGARVHLQDIEALQASRDEQLLKQHIQAVYRDDFLNCKLGQQVTLMQRPKSLAVPGMTTSSSFLQEPQGPVMSMSPQATYLSTIIPNAILPAAIDVIEIDRSRSRRSVRTISKSSLASASPGSSRSGGTRDATSNSSKCSHSQSSETIVSNSSTISLRGNAPPSHATEGRDLNHEEKMSLKSSSSWLSSSSKAASHKPELGELSDSGENARNSRLFTRSLSITKAKLPPAPPRRTYSLHQEKLKQRPRNLVDTKDLHHLKSSGGLTNGHLDTKEELTLTNNEKISTHSPVSSFMDDSHSSLASSPHSPDQDSNDAQIASGSSSPQNKFDRTMSPSSGYSSQSGTPTHSSKDICATSPGKYKVKPPKPERTSARTSPVVSVSSSVNSLTSVATDPPSQSTQPHTTQSQPPKVSPVIAVKGTHAPSGSSLRELFNIPPPPKVKAPCPPPPETWAHNKCTVELLCGPSPLTHRIYELQKYSLLMKNHNTTDHTSQTSAERQISEVKAIKPNSEDKEVLFEKNEPMPVQNQVTLGETPALRHKESPQIHEREEESCPEKENVCCVTQKQGQNYLEGLKMKQESSSEEVPLSSKVDQSVPSPEELSEKSQVKTSALKENDTLSPKTEGTKREDEYIDQHLTDRENPDHTTTQNLSVEATNVTTTSPPPSPPPAHHPPPPPSKKPVSSESTALPDEEHQPDTEKEFFIVECSWPPPPPPMDESADLMFEGQDEVDFPPPPPPYMQESLSNMSEDCKTDCGIKPTCQGDNVTSEELPEHNKELQIILGITMLEKPYNQQKLVDSALSIPNVSHEKPSDQSQVQPQSSEKVSQVCLDLVCTKVPSRPEMSSQLQDIHLQPLLEEKPSPSQEDPPNHTIMSINDLEQATTDVPIAPPLPIEDQSTVNFRRQPSLPSKENKSKELSSRHKGTTIPKEDANIPLVTPSLLQMVRLRSVNVEDQVNILSQDSKPDSEAVLDHQDQGTFSQITPQKPIRKSCLKSAQSLSKSSAATVLAPSMRLQEAIRMKTAAMESSSGVPTRLSLHLPSPTTNSNDMPASSPKTPDGCDLHKSPASTASFIFSKSTKKVVIETPTSPEIQASLKQNLAAELLQISDQAKSVVTNETKKHAKVPPPVAKKPAHAASQLDKLGTAIPLTIDNYSSKQKNGVENGQIRTVQPAGQRAHSPGNQMPASTGETATTVEVS